jgi:uncharacterized protein YbaP (TraB family)
MLFTKSHEKELRMVWEVQKNDKRSFLVGTAHYFPYSFRSSLSKYLKDANTVLFEGPLDKENMAKVVKAGYAQETVPHLFAELDSKTIAQIAKALTHPRQDRVLSFWPVLSSNPEDTLYSMVKGMKSWMAFFTIWASFLQNRGWKYSVDLEAYNLAREMGKNIVFLETIEEQIEVLENLSKESIVVFLKRVDRWNDYAQEYARSYLNGDLENLISMGLVHPTRSSLVIQRRDRIFYERMVTYLEKGAAVACVGAPHIKGISAMLRADGYENLNHTDW